MIPGSLPVLEPHILKGSWSRAARAHCSHSFGKVTYGKYWSFLLFDGQEIEARFLNQGGTYEHLLAQKRTAEKQRKWLSEQKRQLTQQYEAMKYSGESKMSQWV